MHKKPIKVLQVLSSLNTGGTELYAVTNYRYLDKEEVQFDFLVFTAGDNDYYESEVKSYGASVYHIPWTGNYINHLRSVYNFFKKNDYSIIHINSCSLKDILMTSLPAKLSNKPHIIAHAHSPGTPKDTKLDYFLRLILKQLISFSCTEYFACSNNVAKAKYPKKILSRKVKIINNAIDINKFKYNLIKRREIRNKYNLSNDDCLIGMVGRFEKEKNHKFMVEVIKLIEKDNYKLILIGDGSLLNNIMYQVNELNLNDKVIFTQKVDNVYDYYSAIDVLVLPSLYEGFPFVAVEAQASGCPIIISEHVTSDCLLLSQSRKIPIENGIEKWKSELLFFNKSEDEDRKKTFQIIKDAGYDIYDEINALTLLYKSMVKSHE